MNNKHYTCATLSHPGPRGLLTRLIHWQSNLCGQRFYEPEALLLGYSFAPGLRSTAAGLASARASSRRVGTTACSTRALQPPRFSAVIGYEDVAAAKRAKELWDRLRGRMGDSFTFDTHLWRLDILRTAQLRQTAVKDAVEARLIIIAGRRRDDLPQAAKEWIETWVIERRGRPGALVFLVEPAEESMRAITSWRSAYLQEIAQRARMEFFGPVPQQA